MSINQSGGVVGAPSTASNSAARQQRPGFWLWIDHAVLDAVMSHGAAVFAVYAVLCRYASKEQTCFPSKKTIAGDIHMSESTVSRAIESLTSAGLIKKEERYLPSGAMTSNRYRLCAVSPVDPVSPVTGGHCHEGQGEGVTGGMGRVSPATHEPDAIEPDAVEPTVMEPEESFTLSSASADTHTPKVDASRSTKSAPDSRLVDLVERFSSLPDDIRPPKTLITPKLEARFRSAMKTPELREALSDPERIVAAFRRAEYAHGKRWANIWGLLSTKLNSAGEYKLVYLLNGGYEDRGNNGRRTARASSELFSEDF